VRQLAARLEGSDRLSPDQLGEEIAALSPREQAELALRLPAKQRAEVLLHSPKPMRLVRSIADADFYVTVREVGASDALPLLKLGSYEQLQYLIDLEAWRRDRFDEDRSGAWVAMLLEAGEPAIRRFLRNTDDELLALLFRRWLRIQQLEYEDSPEVHGHGLSETGTDSAFVTPDGYFCFSPSIAEHAPAVRRILQLFYQEQPERYQRAIWSSLWELPAELEEQARHWRQSRLEEHGFPRWEEALEVYAPPAGIRSHPAAPQAGNPDALPASRLPLMPKESSNALAPALDALAGEERERALHEVASVANHLLVADGADTGDPLAHRAVLEKVACYLGIALTARASEAPERAARVIAEVPVIELFREGYAAAVDLQCRARRVVRDGWPASHERALELLDPPILARVRAVLAPRPGFVEVDDSGELGEARDFRSSAEIDETRVSLEMAEVVGNLFFRRMNLDPVLLVDAADPRRVEPLRLGALMLTTLAWHATRGELRSDPLPADVIADFLRTVASRRTAAAEAPQRAFERLLSHLVETYSLDAREGALLRGYGRFALELLSGACAGLDPGVPVDPRFVNCLRID
jgi:hypothetical protein